jgi:tagatose 6-phosphate kinase
VTCLGLAGGAAGAAIAADLEAAGIDASLTTIARESRRTVSVVSAATGGSTLFNEPGPEVTQDEWRAFLGAYARSAATARVVVLSGSLPRGVPEGAYGRLAGLARESGVRTIVDADGRALARSLEASPDVVKPNVAELRAATGLDDAGAAMRSMRETGARNVVATFGAEGIRALTAEGAWTARLARPITGVNPTGAGDAVAAALAAGLEDDRDWPSMLEEAVAWSAAAVAAPLAGDLDAHVLGEVRPFVHVVPA